MNKVTEAKFRQKLEGYINYLKSNSADLYLDVNKFDLVFSYYGEYEKRIIDSMRRRTNLDTKKDTRMDRHKVAAAFLCAIITARPIGYKMAGKMPSFIEKTANEQLGLVFGLYIIEIFNSSNREASAVDKEVYGLKPALPECKGDDYDYTIHFTRLINDEKTKKYLDYREPDFNIDLVFFLSHIFFLLDSFSYYKNLADLGAKARGGLCEPPI
jgi:hypothetical protein